MNSSIEFRRLTKYEQDQENWPEPAVVITINGGASHTLSLDNFNKAVAIVNKPEREFVVKDLITS